MAAVVGVLFLHLSLVEKGHSYTQVEAIPGLLLLVILDFFTNKIKKCSLTHNQLIISILLQAFIIVLICPFNIIYKSSRYRLLSVMRNIVLSPLYKVMMLDFFMADQLCSQVINQPTSFINSNQLHLCVKMNKSRNFFSGTDV